MRPSLILMTVLVLLLSACGEDDTGGLSPDLTTARVATTSICSSQGLTSALALGDEQGTIAGMADDPVTTAADHNAVLGTLVAAIEAARLTDTLNDATAVTIFAPTDCAFASLDPTVLQSAMDDPTGLLTDILGVHVVPGQRLSSADLTGGTLETFTGEPLPYVQDDQGILLDGRARVVVPDIQTANATVHLIDTVLVPEGALPAATATPSAPVAPAESSAACGEEQVRAAIASAPEQGTFAGMADDAVSVAVSNNPVLNRLVDSLLAANLVDTLNSTPELTVFAPTDCAFAALDPDRLATAMADPTGLLARILGFHVVPNQRLALADLGAGELATQAGVPLGISSDDAGVLLNGQARIVVADIQTANATVHLIDTVLLPPAG